MSGKNGLTTDVWKLGSVTELGSERVRDGCIWEAMKREQAWLGMNESKNWMLSGVGWLLRERRQNKRKRDERGWEWRKMSGKMQYRGLPSVGFEVTQWKSSYRCWMSLAGRWLERYRVKAEGSTW